MPKAWDCHLLYLPQAGLGPPLSSLNLLKKKAHTHTSAPIARLRFVVCLFLDFPGMGPRSETGQTLHTPFCSQCLWIMPHGLLTVTTKLSIGHWLDISYVFLKWCLMFGLLFLWRLISNIRCQLLYHITCTKEEDKASTGISPAAATAPCITSYLRSSCWASIWKPHSQKNKLLHTTKNQTFWDRDFKSWWHVWQADRDLWRLFLAGHNICPTDSVRTCDLPLSFLICPAIRWGLLQPIQWQPWTLQQLWNTPQLSHPQPSSPLQKKFLQALIWFGSAVLEFKQKLSLSHPPMPGSHFSQALETNCRFERRLCTSCMGM